MNKRILILSIAVAASVCFIRVSAAAPDKLTFLQDENFFLQDEIKKLQAELIDKDNAFKKLLLERETARYGLGGAAKEEEALEEKIGSLNKMLASCDESIRRNAEEAVMPYRSQLKDAADQLKIMAMTLEEKNGHIARVTKEAETLQQQAEMLAAEKISLLQSIRKIAGEYDALKGRVDDQVADAKAEADEKVKDFQVRLAAEQTLVQEKVSQAKKPLENKIAGMETACQAHEVEAVQKEKLPQALLQEKIRKMEQQIVLLRENAGREVKKAQDDAAAEIKKLKDQLNACPQGAQDPSAVKK